jgi:hypothetical protein
MRGVHGFEHLPGGLGVFQLQPFGRTLDKRRFVPQGLEQPQDAVAVLGRAKQHGHDQALLHLLDQIAEYLFTRRLHVGQQLLHQLVIIVGELFEHFKACFALAFFHAGGNFDHLGIGLRPVHKGSFQRQIDKAGGDAVLPDRDLPQHQWLGARGLQGRQDVAHLRFERIDLVQKQKAGDAAVLKLLEDELQGGNALGVGLAHDDGRIATRERQGALMLKFDRTRTIDKGKGVTQEGNVGNIELDAHAVVAGFRGAIPDGISVGDLALARDDARTG